MRKKILGWGLLATFVLTAGAGLVLRQQFYGNAVVTERDLYVSARAEYGQVADSLLPQIKHRRAFDAYARRINLSETFKPGHYVCCWGISPNAARNASEPRDTATGSAWVSWSA